MLSLGARFPRSARLLCPRDFRFQRFQKINLKFFLAIVNLDGKGRLGLSLSKRCLRSAVARNRIRRMIRESFRKQRPLWVSFDLHLIALSDLGSQWRVMDEVTLGKMLTSALTSLELAAQRTQVATCRTPVLIKPGPPTAPSSPRERDTGGSKG